MGIRHSGDVYINLFNVFVTSFKIFLYKMGVIKAALMVWFL